MNLLGPVGKVVHVKARGGGHEQLVMRRHERIFQNHLIKLIGYALLAFEYVRNAEPEKRPLALVKRSDRKRIKPVRIIALGLDASAVLKHDSSRHALHVYACPARFFVKFTLPALYQHYAFGVALHDVLVMRPLGQCACVRFHQRRNLGIAFLEPFPVVGSELKNHPRILYIRHERVEHYAPCIHPSDKCAAHAVVERAVKACFLHHRAADEQIVEHLRILPFVVRAAVVFVHECGQKLAEVRIIVAVCGHDCLGHHVHEIGLHVLHGRVDYRRYGSRLLRVVGKYLVPMPALIQPLAALQTLPFGTVCVGILPEQLVKPFR